MNTINFAIWYRVKNVVFICSIMLCLSCTDRHESTSTRLDYSTRSDSAYFYYTKGWEQIMDDGLYGPAENSYRKALEFDPDFLVGKSVLARLTLDLDERLELYAQLEAGKNKIQGDERLVLDVYTALTHFTNIREQDPDLAQQTLKDVLVLAERNFGQVVHRYPEELYLKAEYIEIIHANHGARAALDTLMSLATEDQQNIPFLLGYAATLQAEEGNYKVALEMASKVMDALKDKEVPKPYAVYADIYTRLDSLDLAKQYADQAVSLDPRNLDASRLKNRIDKKLSEQNHTNE